MTAKEYLLQIMDFDAVIAEDLQELERLRKQKTEIRTVRYDQEKVDMSRNDGKDPRKRAAGEPDDRGKPPFFENGRFSEKGHDGPGGFQDHL